MNMEQKTPDEDSSFVLNIPALRPGTVAFEVAENPAELAATYSRTVERAIRHGTPAEVDAAWRAFGRAHEKLFTAAFMRLRRRASLRPAPRDPRRPRCRARRPRPRSHRRRGGGRGGGGRGGGSDDGGGDPDPRPIAVPTPPSDEEVGGG